MVALFLVKECTFCNAFACKWCWIKSLTVRNGFSSEHFAVVCSPVKPLRHIQPAVNTMNSTWSQTKAHRKLIATIDNSVLKLDCGAVSLHKYMCFTTALKKQNTKVHLDCSYHKVNNFNFLKSLQTQPRLFKCPSKHIFRQAWKVWSPAQQLLGLHCSVWIGQKMGNHWTCRW